MTDFIITTLNSFRYIQCGIPQIYCVSLEFGIHVIHIAGASFWSVEKWNVNRWWLKDFITINNNNIWQESEAIGVSQISNSPFCILWQFVFFLMRVLGCENDVRRQRMGVGMKATGSEMAPVWTLTVSNVSLQRNSYREERTGADETATEGWAEEERGQ